MITPIFLLNFVMYVIVPIVATWELRGILFPADSPNPLAKGIYTDFNSNWFIDAGYSIITTMTLNIFMPLVEFALGWVVRYLKRAWDQRSFSPGNYYQTHCNSIQEFIEIYSGPEFFIYHKYSYILTVVFVAFMFGPLMPCLFLIALASLFCQYTVEQLAMAYAYRKPPMYDGQINDHILKFLSFASPFYALMAIWVYSNQ